jgi:hypothetical protein
VVGQPEDSFILFRNGDRIYLRKIATWSLIHVNYNQQSALASITPTIEHSSSLLAMVCNDCAYFIFFIFFPNPKIVPLLIGSNRNSE